MFEFEYRPQVSLPSQRSQDVENRNQSYSIQHNHLLFNLLYFPQMTKSKNWANQPQGHVKLWFNQKVKELLVSVKTFPELKCSCSSSEDLGELGLGQLSSQLCVILLWTGIKTLSVPPIRDVQSFVFQGICKAWPNAGLFSGVNYPPEIIFCPSSDHGNAFSFTVKTLVILDSCSSQKSTLGT